VMLGEYILSPASDVVPCLLNEVYNIENGLRLTARVCDVHVMLVTSATHRWRCLHALLGNTYTTGNECARVERKIKRTNVYAIKVRFPVKLSTGNF
jgi:hypothetical protein